MDNKIVRTLLSLALFSVLAQAQIIVSGDVTAPLSITALDKFSKVSVSVMEKEKAVTYAGAALFEILQQAGAPFDRDMQDRARHNKAMITSVLVTAKDGYRVVFSLSEIDPKNGAVQVLVIPKPDGSFSLLVPHAGSKARNVKDVQKLHVFQAALE